MSTRPYDLVGIGIGPFNLSLAALADRASDLHVVFVDQKPEFAWHPGLFIDGAKLQVSFLADLVSLVDPTSRWSFLAYLQAHQRLLPFYLNERWRPSRREYDDYCKWVAASLPSCRFGTAVTDLAWDAASELFVVTATESGPGGRSETLLARNVALGVGTEPVIPTQFGDLAGKEVFHVAEYLDHRASLAGAEDVTVIGSGQSGAEVFLDLLRAQPNEGWRLRWLTRSPAFAPMEQSTLGLEHFTPDYTRYFRSLPADTRDRLLGTQWQLYKAISAETIAAISAELYERQAVGTAPADVVMTPNVEVSSADRDNGRITLRCFERVQARETAVTTDRVVLATGFAARRPAFLRGLSPLVRWDDADRYRVDDQFRIELDPAVTGALFVQNGEQHCNGVGTPDLGLGAYRSAAILNCLAGRAIHELPQRSAFTTFGVR